MKKLFHILWFKLAHYICGMSKANEIKQGDRVFTSSGMGRVVAKPTSGKLKNNYWVVELDGGKGSIVVHKWDMIPEGFQDFLLRPGYVGKWTRKEFLIILGFAFMPMVAGIITWPDGGMFGIISTLVILGVATWDLWSSWKSGIY